MKIINLDKTFEPYGKGVDFSIFNFPSGCEPHIKITSEVDDSIIITTRIKSMNDLMILLLATDSLKRVNAKHIRVLIPYLPFARQDRVMVHGEPLSIKVIAEIINSQHYESVNIYDPHSEVSLALINNSVSINNHQLVSNSLSGKENYLIVSPDSGAYKKIFALCQTLNYKDEIVLCNKTRDVSNGNILGVMCPVNDFNRKDLYIVDDICDGGGTFVLLAEELKKRNCGKVNLIVSHGIFSKSIEALTNIDHIFTTDSFQDISNNEKLTQIKLCNLIPI